MMLKERLGAALILAASLVAAAGGQPLSRHAAPAAHPSPGTARPSPAGTREFQFRGLTFTIPASWNVQIARRQPPRMEYVEVTGKPSGPRLMFSNTVEWVSLAAAAPRPATPPQPGQRLAFQRFEMPNPMERSVVYVYPAAGITLSARVRTEAEVRAADAVAASARWSVSSRSPSRS